MSKKRIILLVLAIFVVGIFAIFSTKGTGTEILWKLSNGGKWLLPLVVVSSIIDSINPCAFSILILTIAFLMSMNKSRLDILKIGGFYVLGIFLIYVLIGLGILQALHIFNTPHFMARVGAILLIAFGLINIINQIFPAFPIKLRVPHAAHHKIAELMERVSMPTAFILGALVGLCEFPCTGGPYLMVLGLLHDHKTYLSGLGYLLLYNVIFVLPLIIILMMASDKAVLNKVEVWQKSESGFMRFGGGIAMIVLGLIILIL